MKIVHILIGKPKPVTTIGVKKSVYHIAENQTLIGEDVFVMGITRECNINGEVVCEKPRIEIFKQNNCRFIVDKFFLNRLEEINPCVVNFHSAFIPEFCVIGKFLKKKGIPYVISPRGAYRQNALMKNKLLKKIWLTLFENQLLANANLIHFLTKTGLDEFDDLGFSIDTKRECIPNGIDKCREFDPWKEKGYITKFLELEYDSRVIVSIGRLDIYYKGLDLLIKGFSLLPKNVLQNTYLILFGPDTNGAKIQLMKIANEFGIKDRLLMPGPVYGDDKFRIMAGADIFAVTSRSEGFPNALLEALSVGARCLVSNNIGIENELKSYHAGCLTSIDPTDISTQIQYILENIKVNNFVTELSLNSKKLCNEKFIWRSVAGKLLASYRQIVNV